MGLSRNKVAVSEGAAGSPPFYGERAINRKVLLRSLQIEYIQLTIDGDSKLRESKCCSIFKDQEFLNSRCYKRRGSTRSHSEHGS